jgi:hypothetical protein
MDRPMLLHIVARVTKAFVPEIHKMFDFNKKEIRDQCVHSSVYFRF